MKSEELGPRVRVFAKQVSERLFVDCDCGQRWVETFEVHACVVEMLLRQDVLERRAGAIARPDYELACVFASIEQLSRASRWTV